MFLTDSLTGDLVSLIVTFLLILICYWKWSYQYWRRRNVPYLEPQIPFGNLSKVLRGKEHIGVTLKKIYDEMKSKGWKHGGIYFFNKPSYFPIDLDIIRNILTKDFSYFADRDVYYNEKEPIQAHLVNLTGIRWKNLRVKLTPSFTSGKMKMMFQVMSECQNDLKKRMQQECLKNEPINIKEVLAGFTTNIIGSCAFGLDFKALEGDDSTFRKFGRKIFILSKLDNLKRFFCVAFPDLAKFFNLRLFRTDISDFFLNLVQNTVDYREKNNYKRNDFMQLLINMKNDHDGQALTMDELASQCIVFFAAGFETSSTLMTFVLYELSKHKDIQDKVRTEINSVLAKHDNLLTYDSMQEMPYLNQVIDETLRMHPPGALINRKCVKDYKIVNQDVIIEKGTTVTISILGIHYDEDYYPEATTFDPERFSEENKKLRHNYAHLPFGEGPRNCIGMRFGLLQAKVGLVLLLKDYEFTINQKTLNPMFYQPNNLVLAVQGEVWLDAQKI